MKKKIGLKAQTARWNYLGMENSGKILKWDSMDDPARRTIVKFCGWRISNGEISRTGDCICNKAWRSLSPAARNVLSSHGVIQ